MPLSTELITSLQAFEAMQGEWNELVCSMAEAEIFHFWEWNFHYFRHYRHSAQAFIIVVRDDRKKIVGLAPFCLRRVRRLGWTTKVLETIVVEIADYRNVFVRRDEHKGRVVGAILDFLHDNAALWDVVDVAQLSSRDSTTFQLFNAATERADWTAHLHLLTPIAVRFLKSGRHVENESRLRRVRNRRKTLEKRGLRLQVGCGYSDELWTAFRDLHRKTWHNSPFLLEHGEKFFDDLTSSPGMRSKLEFSVAEIDGKPAAMHFGFVDDRKVYFYMPVMDAEFRQDRVGAVLLHAMIDHYTATHEVFDFMRGTEDYKAWYTDTLEGNFRLVFHRSGSWAAFTYNILDSTRRHLIELGLPRAIRRGSRKLLSGLRRRTSV